MTVNRETADFFEAALAEAGKKQAKTVANWIMGDVNATLNSSGLEMAEIPVTPAALAKLVTRITDGTISHKAARDVFQALWAGENDADVDKIIEAKGLKQISDSGAIEALVDTVLEANADIVEEYRSGKDKAFNSLVGRVMREAKGKANPAQVNEILKQKLG
jgi:aspartyl-tRNA(Asn)/glutamyl-tRNA(Gln) amidotransferase subunit B